MLSGATPFKIHDENAGDGTVKSNLGNGTAKKRMPMVADGISTSKTPMLTKSSRKALGAISVNKLGGLRDDAPVEDKMMSSKLNLMTTNTTVAAMNIKSMNSGVSDVSGMICSQVSRDEDVFDVTIKNASKIKTVLVPSTSIDRPNISTQDENDNDEYTNWQTDTCDQEQVVDADNAALSFGRESEHYSFVLPSTEDW